MSSKEWAVKLRPQTLEQMAGQESNKLIVQSWIDNDNLPNALIFYGKSGTGKALKNGTKVLTSGGYKPIEELTLNDLVASNDGKFYKLNGIYPQGIKSCYKITLNHGNTIYASGDHIWTISRDYGKTYHDETTEEILSKGYAYTEPKTGWVHHEVVLPPVQPLELPEQNLPIDPYLLGCLIGDGSLSNNFGFSTEDQFIIDKLNAILRRDWNMELRKHSTSQHSDWTICFIDSAEGRRLPKIKNYRTLSQTLSDLGMRVSAEYKHIPKQYLQGSIEQRRALLAGLMDTDGYVEKSGSSDFTSVSRQLVQDVKYLAESLGIVTRVRYDIPNWYSVKGVRYPAKPAHTVMFYTKQVLCTLPRKVERENNKRNRKVDNDMRIHAIERVEDAECTCISIQSPNHLFIAENRIPTHNTTLARMLGLLANAEVIELDAASHNSVDDARQINELAGRLSLTGRHKRFLIDEAHQLSTAAFNVLLKNIEEPNPKVHFIFCMSEDSLVETERGTLKIKDVLPTDRVFDGKSFKQVKAVYNNGQRECLRITLANGQTIDCTPDHKIKVLQGLHEVWREAKDLVVGNNLAVYHSYKAQTSAGLSRAECWMLGHMIGDGSYDQHGVCLHASTSKLDGILRAVSELIEQGILVDTAFSKRTIDNPNFKEIQLHFGAKGPKEWLDKCGVDYNYMGSGRQKHLPTSVYSMSKEEFMSFVAGWYEADGSIWKYYSFFDLSEGTPQLSCYNESLYKDLLTLLISHGFDARIFIDKKSMEGVGYIGEREVRPTKPSASVYLRKHSGYFNEPALREYLLEHSSYTNYKNERIVSATALKDSRRRISPEMLSTLPELSGNKWFTQIVKIEPIGIKTVYDLEVPESHCFVANNVVVHNCTTEYAKLPLTIRGRSRMLKFYSIPREQQVEYAKAVLEHEGYTLSDDVIDLVVDQSNGQMRDLLKLLQTTCEAKLDSIEKLKKFLAIPDNKGMRNFINAVLSGNPKNGVKVLNEIDTDLLEWIAALQKHIYQLLEDKYGITPINTKDITTYNKIKALENKFTDRQFGALLTELNKINRAETAYAQLYALLFRGIDV